ncbi:MAG: hypothetical protein Q9208_007329 [Pyrenodesmia sp. 3 TL-2023]
MEHPLQTISKELTTLPHELLHHILGYLTTCDLKHTRLTCKTLLDISLPLLSTTVVVSTSCTDLDIFRAISERPHLSKHVTTLVYDVQIFGLTYTYDRYEKELHKQVSEDTIWESYKEKGAKESIMRRVFGCKHPLWPPFWSNQPAQYENATTVLREGEAAYNYQRGHQLDPSAASFGSILALGLKQFSNIRNIIIQDSWAKTSDFSLSETGDDPCPGRSAYRFGAVARSWHPLWLRPRRLPALDQSLHCDTLQSALTTAKIQPRLLDGGWFQHSYCREWHNGSRDFLAPGFTESFATESLTCLRVRLEYPGILHPELLSIEDDGLRAVFQVPSIRKLDVGFGCPRIPLHGSLVDENASPFPYSGVVGKSLMHESAFPHLTTLCLENFTVSGTGFLHYLRNRPSLRILYVRNLYLNDSTWDEVFAGLRGLPLTVFGLERLAGSVR